MPTVCTQQMRSTAPGTWLRCRRGTSTTSPTPHPSRLQTRAASRDLGFCGPGPLPLQGEPLHGVPGASRHRCGAQVGHRGEGGASRVAERAACCGLGGPAPVMNLDDIQLPLLLNSRGGLGGRRDGKGSPSGPRDSVSEPPRQRALDGRRPSPRASAGPRSPQTPRLEPRQGEQHARRCSACPALGGLGTSPASELICLQTPSPCQRQ